MEIGRKAAGNMSAKELTEAIEAATDSVIENNGEDRSDRAETYGGGLDQPASFEGVKPQGAIARDLGRIAQIAGGGTGVEPPRGGISTEERIIASNNEVKQMVAVENGYAEAGDLTPGENVVGGESKIEIKERLADDREAAEAQGGEGLSKDQQWIHEIAVRSGKELATSVQEAVAKIASESDPNPRDLEKLRFGGMLKAMLGDNGRTFGERN